MAHLPQPRVGIGRAEPQLPAFCRTRKPVVTISTSSLQALRNLLVLMLLVQLSTVLLVIAGPLSQASLPSHQRSPLQTALPVALPRTQSP